MMQRTASRPLLLLVWLAWLPGCPKDTGAEGAGSSSGSGGPTTAPTSTEATVSASSTMTSSADSGTTADGNDGTSASDATVTGSDSSGTAGTGNDTGNPIDCGGTIYACGDGVDNDEDGNIDLHDPECTGPCDDDEATFQTGLPGDNMDCKQDCFFDGNSGQGDDGCIWDLRCDPANPGANVNCEYTGGNNCNNQPPNQDPDCVMFCEQYVPPGCDCFGCCTVQTPDGPVDIFLNSGPDCSLANLDGCQSCTTQIDDCGNPCLPDSCQICFGESEVPEGCDENECPGDPCDSDQPDTCPYASYCYLGCCYPEPRG